MTLLETLSRYPGYTLMKHCYEPTVKYRLQIWYMRPGAGVPTSVVAWGETPEKAYSNWIITKSQREISVEAKP